MLLEYEVFFFVIIGLIIVFRMVYQRIEVEKQNFLVSFAISIIVIFSLTLPPWAILFLADKYFEFTTFVIVFVIFVLLLLIVFWTFRLNNFINYLITKFL